MHPGHEAVNVFIDIFRFVQITIFMKFLNSSSGSVNEKRGNILGKVFLHELSTSG